MAVAGALMLAVLITVVVPGLTADGGNAPASKDAAPGQAPEVRGPGQDQDRVRDEPVDVAGAALDAWARFAVTGDLAVLDGTFDRGGPQYRLLQAEAEVRSAAAPDGPAYEVELADIAVEGLTQSKAVVSATVRWSRTGEAEQSFEWDLVLRRGSGDRWRLWTVMDRALDAVPRAQPGA